MGKWCDAVWKRMKLPLCSSLKWLSPLGWSCPSDLSLEPRLPTCDRHEIPCIFGHMNKVVLYWGYLIIYPPVVKLMAMENPSLRFSWSFKAINLHLVRGFRSWPHFTVYRRLLLMDMITYDNPQSICILCDALIMNAWHLWRVTDDAYRKWWKPCPKRNCRRGYPLVIQHSCANHGPFSSMIYLSNLF